MMLQIKPETRMYVHTASVSRLIRETLPTCTKNVPRRDARSDRACLDVHRVWLRDTWEIMSPITTPRFTTICNLREGNKSTGRRSFLYFLCGLYRNPMTRFVLIMCAKMRYVSFMLEFCKFTVDRTDSKFWQKTSKRKFSFSVNKNNTRWHNIKTPFS